MFIVVDDTAYRASNETKKVGGGPKVRCQNITTAKDDVLPVKSIVCKKIGGGGGGNLVESLATLNEKDFSLLQLFTWETLQLLYLVVLCNGR